MISTKEILTYSITAMLLFAAAHMSPWLVLGIYLCMILISNLTKGKEVITTNNTLPLYSGPQGYIITEAGTAKIGSTIETPASKSSKPTKRPKRTTSPKTVEQERTPKKITRRSTKN